MKHIEKTKSRNFGLKNAYGILSCGHTIPVTELHNHDVWDEEHHIHHVDDIIDCENCDAILNKIEVIKESIADGSYHHGRALANGYGHYAFYRLDHSSPSCFSLITQLGDCELTREFVKTVPTILSPREGA